MRCDVRTVRAGFKPALTDLCARMRGTSDTVCWVSAARSSLECPCRQNDVEAGRQECPPHLQASFFRVQAYVWRSHFAPGDQLTCHSERSGRNSRSFRCKCERDLRLPIWATDCNQYKKKRRGEARVNGFDPSFYGCLFRCVSRFGAGFLLISARLTRKREESAAYGADDVSMS